MVARSFPRTGLHVLLEGCFMCTIGFSLLGQMPSNIPKHCALLVSETDGFSGFSASGHLPCEAPTFNIITSLACSEAAGQPAMRVYYMH